MGRGESIYSLIISETPEHISEMESFTISTATSVLENLPIMTNSYYVGALSGNRLCVFTMLNNGNICIEKYTLHHENLAHRDAYRMNKFELTPFQSQVYLDIMSEKLFSKLKN